MNNECYVIAGPTASGKSDLALCLAESVGGEIICMDSMQIYRQMNIGTAKPSSQEKARVPHHLFDIVSPMEEFSVAMYQERAEACAREILSRGRIPVFCGGTGFYLRALREQLTMGNTPADSALRAALEAEAALPGGKERLHERLYSVDPQSAERLHCNDVRRVIRALEVFQLTGRPISAQTQVTYPDKVSGEKREETGDGLSYRVICLDMARDILYDRINRRVDRMIAAGLVEEVESLLRHGVSPDAQAMKGIGYKELIPFLAGNRTQESLQEAVDLIKLNTRHYAKRQLTWMRREKDVHWMDALSPDLFIRAKQGLTEDARKEEKNDH